MNEPWKLFNESDTATIPEGPWKLFNGNEQTDEPPPASAAAALAPPVQQVNSLAPAIDMGWTGRPPPTPEQPNASIPRLVNIEPTTLRDASGQGPQTDSAASQLDIQRSDAGMQPFTPEQSNAANKAVWPAIKETAKESWQTFNEPILHLANNLGLDGKTVADAMDTIQAAANYRPGQKASLAEHFGTPSRTPTTGENVFAGIQTGVLDAVDGLVTPFGITLLGSGALPKLAQRGIALAFATQMSLHAPEQFQQFLEAKYAGDEAGMAKAITAGIATGAFIAGSLKHAVAKGKVPGSANEKYQEPNQQVKLQPTEPLPNQLEKFNEVKTYIQKLFPGINIELAPSNVDIEISPDGKTLRVSHELLDLAKKMYPGREHEALKLAVQEELIHHRQFKALGENFESKLDDLWVNASKEVKDSVRAIYGGDAGMKSHHWGAELLRMAAQAKESGSITESIHPRRGKAAREGLSKIQEWADRQTGEISDAINTEVKPTEPLPNQLDYGAGGEMPRTPGVGFEPGEVKPTTPTEPVDEIAKLRAREAEAAASAGADAPLPGERWITVRRKDGSTYRASTKGAIFDMGDFGKHVQRAIKNSDGHWSHGIIGKEDTVISDEAGILGPKPEIPKAEVALRRIQDIVDLPTGKVGDVKLNQAELEVLGDHLKDPKHLAEAQAALDKIAAEHAALGAPDPTNEVNFRKLQQLDNKINVLGSIIDRAEGRSSDNPVASNRARAKAKPTAAAPAAVPLEGGYQLREVAPGRFTEGGLTGNVRNFNIHDAEGNIAGNIRLEKVGDRWRVNDQTVLSEPINHRNKGLVRQSLKHLSDQGLTLEGTKDDSIYAQKAWQALGAVKEGDRYVLRPKSGTPPAATGAKPTEPTAPTVLTPANVEHLLNVSTPDAESARKRNQLREDRAEKLRKEAATLSLEQKEIEKRIKHQRGNAYTRSKIKRSANRLDVERYNRLSVELRNLGEQISQIHDEGKSDRAIIDESVDASIINNPKEPLVRRLDRLYRQKGGENPEIAKAFDEEMKRVIREKYPDITDEEMKRIRPELQSAIYFGGDFWKDRNIPDLQNLRRDQLQAVVTGGAGAGDGSYTFGNLPPELQKKINKHIANFRVYTEKSKPVEDLSAKQVADLKKEIADGVTKWREDLAKEAERSAQEKKDQAAKEEKLLVEAQQSADSAKRSGLKGGRSAVDIKNELIRRVKEAIDKLADKDRVFIKEDVEQSNPEDGKYFIASSESGGHAAGWVRPAKDKFQVRTWRGKVTKENPAISVVMDTEAEAISLIRGMAAEGRGNIVIGIPGDGVQRLVNRGESLVKVYKGARSLSTATAEQSYTTRGIGEQHKPPEKVTTAAEWVKAKEYHGLNPLDKIHDWSPALNKLAKKLNPEHPEQVTAHDVDSYIKAKFGVDTTTKEPEKPAAEPEKPAKGPETPPVPPQPPPEPPLAFGGGHARPPKPPAPTLPPGNAASPATPPSGKTPGLGILSSIRQGILSLLLPSAKSPEHLHYAEILGGKLGAMARRVEAAIFQLRLDSRMFDRLGVHDERLEPGKNPGIQFMSDMAMGRELTGNLKAIGDKIDRLFAGRLQKLEEAGASLQTIRENYFPGMWTHESRLAFNAALEEAFAEGVLPREMDLNDPTAEQKAWVKAKVDEHLKAGTGSEADQFSYLTRNPMKGKESFRKQKVFEDIMQAAEFGLRPISNNPIDLVKLKLAEMDKSIMANEFFQRLKHDGKLRIINPYEEVPEGWVKINDKYGTIYGKPTVTIPEYIDKKVYEGLLKVAADLGISHERLMKFPKVQGQRALGLSFQGGDRILSRFGTETSVIAHEIGHQLDHKYGLWDKLTGGKKANSRSPEVTELRAIAKETERGKTAQSKEEKIAQVMEAYIHTPELMQKIAPLTYATFDRFIKSHPELQEFAAIKPGLALKQLTGEKYVGLPIMGYRIVPEAAGDIMNNYLSSSLYNNQYFGGLYKGWMAIANALNQTQLGVGSAFHASFTTAEAQISAGSNLLKDIYGVLRGNRSAGDLIKTTGNFVTASVKTAMTGDKVLNAWRNPKGVMDPRIAQIVKATELAGGGYKLEAGLATEQATKAYRDWFSGHRIRAAARSPVASVELMAKPIMDFLVPRQKAGVFSELASRIIEENPGRALEDLTPQFRAAWNRVDARLGQVRYNRLFINNTAKNIIQGLIRAPGWTGGTITEIGGAFPDAMKFFKEWKDTGKIPDNLPDRTAYTASLLITAGIANAILTYGFTGKTPVGLDYFAFRTGKKDEQGNEERFLLPTYMKDLLAYARQPVTTLEHKLHPLLSVIDDVARNRDYYGYEIRNPHGNLAEQTAQTTKYVIKAFEPFWTRGVRKEMDRKATAVRTALPFVGVMPAPAYITRSPIQSKIAELYHLRTGERTKPFGTQEKDAEKRKSKNASTMDIYMFKRLPLSDRNTLRQKMSKAEKRRYSD